jgi:hypothetical protein
MASILGGEAFFFDFFEPGGPNNLKPGRPLEQSRRINRPAGSGFMVSLSQINGAFVTGGGNTLTQRPLGQFNVRVGVRDPNILVCRVRLTDENMDDPIRIQVGGFVLFFA